MDTQILIESLAYGGIALILSISGRAFGTINLSAGSWVTVGSWFAFAGLRVIEGSPTELVATGAFWLVLLVALVQASSALVLRRNLIEQPLAFLLIALGCHRAVEAVSTRWLVSSAQARIPSDSFHPAISALGIVVVAAAAIAVKNTRWFSKVAVRARTAGNAARVWPVVGAVLLGELGLLFLLGMFAGPVLRGVPGNEFLTIVPVLAVCATRFDSISASIVSAVAVLAMRGLEGSVPGLGSAAVACVLIALAVAVGVRFWPQRLVTGARRVEKLLPRWPTSPDGLGPLAIVQHYLRHPLIAPLFGGICIALMLVVRQPNAHALLRGLFVLALTVAAARTMRLLEVRTIAWPLLAAAGALLAASGASVLIMSVWTAAVLCIWALYALALRTLPASAALVIDLAIVVAIVKTGSTLGVFGGAEGTKELSLPGGAWPLVVTSGLLVSVTSLLWTGAPWLTRSMRGRGMVLGVANLMNGEANGIPTIIVFISGVLIIGSATMLAGVCWAADAATLADRDVSIAGGLLILLLSSVLDSVPFALGATAIVLISGVAEKQLAGSGSTLDLIVGAMLVAFVWTTTRKLERAK